LANTFLSFQSFNLLLLGLRLAPDTEGSIRQYFQSPGGNRLAATNTRTIGAGVQALKRLLYLRQLLPFQRQQRRIPLIPHQILKSLNQ